MKYILPIIWICACLHKTPNGRTYRLAIICEQGHFREGYTERTGYDIREWVCDSTTVDTLWVEHGR